MTDPDYPRDLRGYGGRPPAADWPGNARIAVQFVVNYEEGAENCVLHGDTGSEAFLSEIVGATAYENQRHMNMESLYEYGARAGFWRLHRLFKERELPATVFGVAMALARNPEAVAAMQAARWEIASHGYRWIDYQFVDADTERKHLRMAIDTHTRVTGSRPLGWYLGRCSPNSHRLVAEEGGFVYNADTYADDLPYWDRSYKTPQLMVPYTLDVNDMRFATPQGFNSGTQFFDYLRDSFDLLRAEGGRMMSIGLHCRLAGRPGRAAAVARFLDYVAGFDDVWICRRIDIARHWRKLHPPGESAMHDFVARYGAVYEHSPWVAEEAQAIVAGGADTSAIAAAMAQCVNDASTERQLDLIKAHPDLAGRAQVAGELSEDSTREQASAGLDRCSSEEFEKLQQLNAAYRRKFQFPFVMAVRDSSVAEILRTLERRLDKDYDAEFETAIAEIHKIARLRLDALEDS